jgi:L-asparaginase
MAKEASITKMMWALGQTQDPSKIKEIMYTNYVGELSAE